MKKLILLASIILTAFFSPAQNNVAINNDGTSAAASAMLEVKSTTKGLLMPRVNSAQRSTIADPALGLLVFDTDTKTIWAYDGTSWKNLYTSGGLTLPFAQTVNTGTTAFQVTNQGTGAAIEGSSSAEFGTGLTAKTTGNGGWGLYAFSNGVGAKSINSFADNGTAFHGENNNPANTNTLINTINRGIGKTASFQLTNTASTSFNVQIAGNNLGEQLKIYQTNAANTQSAVSIENSGTGTGLAATSTTGDGVVGTSNTGYGIKGITNTALGKAGVHGQNNGTAGSGVVGVSHAANTQGVYGSSQNGIAVRALGDNYRAVQATSNGGTALYGSSTTGLGLEINGNVKIAGGNTNPSNGAVLTSDATGNAVWKNNKVAFSVTGINDSYKTYPAHVYDVVHLSSEEFDYGNRYNYYSGSTPSFGHSVFVPTITGVYHFDALIGLRAENGESDIFNVTLAIKIIRVINQTGVIIDGAVTEFSSGMRSIKYMGEARISKDIKLLAGDIVFLEINNSSDTNYILNIYSDTEPHFGCHLVFED